MAYISLNDGIFRNAPKEVIWMNYVPIPGLDKPCSQLVIGTSGFSPQRKTDVFALLDAYVEHGGNTIDTAHLYGHGNSELTVGMWMKSRGKRSELVIIDKGGHHHVSDIGEHDAAISRVTPKEITKDLTESLERLQTDYIDLYLLHRDDLSVPVDELMDMLQEHVRAGLVRGIGVSNWTVQRIEEANQYADNKGYNRLVANSPSLSLAEINEPRWPGAVYAGQSDIEWHKKTQLPLFSWASQASGFFTGRYSPDIAAHPDIVRVYYNEANWERFDRAAILAKRKGPGLTANHIALAYVLSLPLPICAVIGPQNEEELCSSMRALEIRLTDDEMLWLNLER